jgi:hypothetical protein
VRYIGERFGTTYPRRGWLKPLALGLLAFVCYIVFVTALAIAVNLGRVA